MKPTEIVVKSIVALTLGALAFIGVWIPVKKVGEGNEWVLGPLNAFAAGVFLSLAVIHLMPEAGEGLPEKYELSGLTTMVGYLAVLGVEQYFAREGYVGLEGTSDEVEEEMHGVANDGESTVVGVGGNRLERAGGSVGYMLLAALSFHSVIEGLTIGIEPTSKVAILMGVSIGIHKGIAGLALGSNLLCASHTTKDIHYLALVFAASTPLGVLLGLFARTMLPAAAGSLIKSLSAGTFLYVGATELVPSEFPHSAPGQKRNKFIGFTLGITIIYLLTTLFDFS